MRDRASSMSQDNFDASTFGDKIAASYDEFGGIPDDTEAAVDFLAERAGKQTVLELGVGTGRLAIPLNERGYRVEGIDASAEMIRQMRLHPGGELIPVTVGTFATIGGDKTYSMIFSVFNSFLGLESQDEQVSCIRTAAEHLTQDGCLIIEAEVPEMRLYSRGQNTHVYEVTPNRIVMSASLVDPVGQHVTMSRIVATEDGLRMFPWKIRYVWPSELDLMARLGGLELTERWGGWHHEPFTAFSFRHVSVYKCT
jgi:SAM-dependent methyltransferase